MTENNEVIIKFKEKQYVEALSKLEKVKSDIDAMYQLGIDSIQTNQNYDHLVARIIWLQNELKSQLKYREEELIMYSKLERKYHAIEKKYKSLENSKLGKLTISYWKVMKKVRGR